MTPPVKPAYLSRLHIRGMSLEALNWAKAQAVAEQKNVGHLLSELMYEYRNDVSRSRDSLPAAPYRDYSDQAITMRGIDKALWRWLRGQAKLEKKTAVQLLCELIGRYQGRVKEMGFEDPKFPSPGLAGPIESKTSGQIPYRADMSSNHTIYGTNPSLWKLMQSRVKLENRTHGELVNEVIDTYRESAGESDAGLEMTSPYRSVTGERHSIRGIDETLWRWLRTHSILEGCDPHEVLNELLYRRVSAPVDLKPVVRTRYLECIMCGRLFEAKRRDSRACSSRCTVALYRARKSGRVQD